MVTKLLIKSQKFQKPSPQNDSETVINKDKISREKYMPPGMRLQIINDLKLI